MTMKFTEIRCRSCNSIFSVIIKKPYHETTDVGSGVPLRRNTLWCPICSSGLTTYNYFKHVTFEPSEMDQALVTDLEGNEKIGYHATNIIKKQQRDRFKTLDVV